MLKVSQQSTIFELYNLRTFQFMRTRNNPIKSLIDEGYNQYKDIKIPQMKSKSKNMKQDQMTKEVQKISKSSTQQNKSKRTSKSMVSEEKKTPQKQTSIKINTSKMMPATRSTARKMASSNKMQQAEGEKYVQVEGMNEVAKNLFADKSKKIKKQSKKNNKTQEYQNFYKFNLNKLKQEHPNWSGEKITQLISLLWKKRKMDVKYESAKEVEQIYQKIMNGKQVFKQFKIKSGASQKEIDGLWSRLPVQSKRKWELESNGIVLQKTNKKKGKMSLIKTEQPQEQQNQFNFLKKVMW